MEPLYDDFSDISYIKKFATIFNDDTFPHFFPNTLLREKITQTVQAKIFASSKEEPTYKARKKYYERPMVEELDAVDTYEKNLKSKKKRIFKGIDEKITDCFDLRKTKIIIDFNDRESASIKLFAVKKKNEIKAIS